MDILVITLILLLVVSGSTLGWLMMVSLRSLRGGQLQRAHEARRLLAQARGAPDRPRYEIQILELGEQAPSEDQQWRASVWDADGGLRIVAYPEDEEQDAALDAARQTHLGTRDPEGVTGIEVPYTVCDGRTYEDALLAADSWVSQQGVEAVVLATGSRLDWDGLAEPSPGGESE